MSRIAHFLSGHRRQKYAAIPTIIDSVRFASKREAARYNALKLLVLAKQIGSLELQPVYRCEVDGRHICDYRGDFRYVDLATGEVVLEDVKGMKTDVYRLKKKLVEALYPIQIREV